MNIKYLTNLVSHADQWERHALPTQCGPEIGLAENGVDQGLGRVWEPNRVSRKPGPSKAGKQGTSLTETEPALGFGYSYTHSEQWDTTKNSLFCEVSIQLDSRMNLGEGRWSVWPRLVLGVCTKWRICLKINFGRGSLTYPLMPTHKWACI